MDFGAKKNIARSLNERGCEVTVYPADTPAEEVLAANPDGIMLSNGPGDPKENVEIIKEIKKMYDSNVPIFAICLGHQLMALANGMDTYKLKYGHRGGNHPVKDLETGRVYISSQNHGYAVDTNAGNYYQAPIYLLPNVEYSDETTGLTESHTYVMAPYAEGIAVPDVDVENITYTKLLTTSESSLLKTDVKNAASFEKEEGDIDGPLCIGVKAEKTLDSGSAVLYVFSSAQFFTDNVDNAVSGNNKTLFTNIMSTIASHDVSVSVPVKSYSYDNLTASTKDVVLFETVVVILIPLALIIIGFVIWFKRRKK